MHRGKGKPIDFLGAAVSPGPHADCAKAQKLLVALEL
jgi:hypothetical protein